MYNRLLELLHKLPQPSQDKITSLAKKDADHFCERYSLTLPEQKDVVYHYYLSKRVRFAWFSSVNFEHADPVDIAAFGELPTMEELEQRRQKYIEDMDKPVHTPWGTWHKTASTLQQEMRNTRRLQEILHKMDIEVETVLTSTSIGKALRLCERYDILSMSIYDSAYRYFLCKALRCALFAPGIYEHADQADIDELYRIQEYFHDQLREMLNENLKVYAARHNLPKPIPPTII